MSLEEYTTAPDYAILKVVFYSDKAKRVFSKSKRLDEDTKKDWKGEIERSLRIYMETDKEGVIQSCGLTPTSCPAGKKEVELITFTHTKKGDKQKIKDCGKKGTIDPKNPTTREITIDEKLPSGEFYKEEITTKNCACSIQFYCQDGFWSDNSSCMERPSKK